MFELWPSGKGNTIVKSGIGLIDVDLSLVFDGVCEVTGKIGSVSSAEVLNEMLLWGVSKNYYYPGMYFRWRSRNLSFYFFYLEFSHQLGEYWFIRKVFNVPEICCFNEFFMDAFAISALMFSS